MHRKLLFTLAVWLLASTALVGADKKAKILLIGKDLDHARNTHTYMSDCVLLAKCLRQTDGVETVISNGWPKNPAVLKDVTAVVLHNRLGGTVLFRGPQRQQVEELLKQGVGVTAIIGARAPRRRKAGRGYKPWAAGSTPNATAFRGIWCRRPGYARPIPSTRSAGAGAISR